MELLLSSLSALPISKYRNWGGQKVFNKKLYESLFLKYGGVSNAYRIYLPLNTKPIQMRIKVPPEISKFVAEQGYKIEDYLTGIVNKNSDGRTMKLGKFLNKNKRPDLLKLFESDPVRKRMNPNKTEMLMVISRHPYDIAGMSTGRSWKSCTNLDHGINANYVIDDVKGGSLIAYLIRADDKNINRPIARVRILRYENPLTNEYVLLPQGDVYGQNDSKFLPSLNKWLEEVNGKPTSSFFQSMVEYTDNAPKELIKVDSKETLDDLGDTIRNKAVEFESSDLVDHALKSNIPPVFEAALKSSKLKASGLRIFYTRIQKQINNIENERGYEQTRAIQTSLKFIRPFFESSLVPTELKLKIVENTIQYSDDILSALFFSDKVLNFDKIQIFNRILEKDPNGQTLINFKIAIDNLKVIPVEILKVVLERNFRRRSSAFAKAEKSPKVFPFIESLDDIVSILDGKDQNNVDSERFKRELLTFMLNTDKQLEDDDEDGDRFAGIIDRLLHSCDRDGVVDEILQSRFSDSVQILGDLIYLVKTEDETLSVFKKCKKLKIHSEVYHRLYARAPQKLKRHLISAYPEQALIGECIGKSGTSAAQLDADFSVVADCLDRSDIQLLLNLYPVFTTFMFYDHNGKREVDDQKVIVDIFAEKFKELYAKDFGRALKIVTTLTQGMNAHCKSWELVKHLAMSLEDLIPSLGNNFINAITPKYDREFREYVAELLIENDSDPLVTILHYFQHAISDNKLLRFVYKKMDNISVQSLSEGFRYGNHVDTVRILKEIGKLTPEMYKQLLEMRIARYDGWEDVIKSDEDIDLAVVLFEFLVNLVRPSDEELLTIFELVLLNIWEGEAIGKILNVLPENIIELIHADQSRFPKEILYPEQFEME